MARVAEFIERHREHLTERYAREVRRLESARGLNEYEVTDTLPEYLGILAAISRQGHGEGELGENKRRMEEMHIRVRLRVGYNQEEATTEYVLIGQLIAATWEGLSTEAQPPPEDRQLLFDGLEGAMAGVVRAFTGYSVEDRQREKRYLRRLDALSPEAIGGGTHPVPLSKRLEPLLEVIQEAMKADGVALFIIEEDGHGLPLTASVGLGAEPPGAYRTFMGAASFVGRIAAQDEPLQLSDAAHAPVELSEAVRHSGLRSLMGVRVKPFGRLRGVLYVGVKEVRPFPPQDERYLETLADYLAGIIDRALLFEQVRAGEEKLRVALGTVESQRRLLDAVLEQMPAAVFVAEAPSGRLLKVNRQVDELLRHPYYPAADVAGYGQYQGFHPDGRPYAPEDWPLARAVQKGEEVRDEETIILRGDGTRGHFLLSAAPVRDPEGCIFAGVVTLSDVTERKRTEAALREAELRFRRILDSGIIGIVEWDASGALSGANDALLSMLGYTREDLAAGRLDFRKLTPPEHQAVTERAVRTLKERGFVEAFEKQYLRKDGSPVDILISSATLDEHRDRGIALVLDISERKAMETVLRRREEEYRTLAESMPQVVWTANPDGQVEYSNAVLARYLGGSSEPAMGMSWLELLHPEDMPLARERWAHSVSTGEPYEVEFRIRRHDGLYRWFLARAVPLLDGQGRARKWFGTATDIEDLKHAQWEAHKRALFEQHLVGIVSHDLRNPLNAILLTSTALARREELDERTAKSLLRIQSSAERAIRMIRDLLDFTQARLGGGIPIQPKALDLGTFVRAVVDEVQLTFPEREIRVEHGGDGRGSWDADRLAQVLTNLLANALRYSPADTPVSVKSRGRDGRVELEVHNHGAPIPSEVLGRLFQPMQRGTPHGDPTGRSVGLGLFIVQHIVHAHGGTIAVRSTEAEGTTFTVHLPRASAPAAAT